MMSKEIEGSFPEYSSTDSSTGSSTVSLGVFEQVKWERDVALEQLEELGYCLGEKIRTDEDCISRKELIEKARQGGLVGNRNFESVCKWINSLPSVTPDAVSREVIAYKETIRKIMEGLEEYLEEYNYVDENGNHELKWCAISEAKMLVEDCISEACEIIDSGRTREQMLGMVESLESPTESTDDCISRKAAVRACCGMSRFTGIDEAPYEYVEDVLRELPPVKPNIDVDALITKIERELASSMYDDWGNTTDLHDQLVGIIREFFGEVSE